MPLRGQRTVLAVACKLGKIFPRSTEKPFFSKHWLFSEKKKCSSNQNFTTMEKAADNLFSSEKDYQILVKRKTFSPEKSKGKGLAEDIFSNVQVNWEIAYQLPFLCTTETKLRVF